MVRSWAYILMIAATLAGLVALVWPSPKVQTIEEIAMPARTAPTRAEPAPKPAKAAAKSPQGGKRDAPPAPAPAAVARKMPAPNTATRRQLAQPENGMQPSPFSKLNKDAAQPQKNPPPIDTGAPPRPAMPFRPGTTPPREPAAR
jgi:hypothetical protein